MADDNHVTVGYEGAMQQLQQMFEGFDREVIHMCLESNQGRLEPTIDQLLALSTDATAADVTPSTGGNNNNSSGLDDAFLNLGVGPQGGGGGQGGQTLSQVEADEAFAQMLQQELFMEELARNDEFMRALDEDTARVERRGVRQQQQQQQRARNQSASRTNVATANTGTSFKQKLTNMSEATKRQFKLLGDKFMGKKSTDTETVRSSTQYTELPTYGDGLNSNLHHRQAHQDDDDLFGDDDTNSCAIPLSGDTNLGGDSGGLHDRRSVRQRGAVGGESKKSQ